jgi:phospholipid/cholesterol/gamma-HCH transport system substrate-binding protein
MEYRKSEIRAGIFLLTAFIVFAVMVFAVSDIQSLFKKTMNIRVLFSFSDGIEKNAPVRFSGIRVGKVTNIRVAPEQSDKVEVTLSVYEDTVVKEDTRVAIKSLGLVGGKYVELSGGSSQAKALGEGGVLNGEESLKMEDLTRKGMEVVDKLRNIAGNLDRTLGDPSLGKAIKATLQNARDITANIKDITSNKEEVAQSLKNLPELLKKLEASTANLKDVTEKADKLVGDNRKNVDQTMENVREISDNLKDFTAEIKAHPWKLIRKP